MARHTDRYWINQHNAQGRAGRRLVRFLVGLVLVLTLADGVSCIVVRHLDAQTAITAALRAELGNRP